MSKKNQNLKIKTLLEVPVNNFVEDFDPLLEEQLPVEVCHYVLVAIHKNEDKVK